MGDDLEEKLAADREWLVNQIAHALRNPIFAASVQTESLLMRSENPEAITKTVTALSGQLERLSKNIDEMLLFGRPIRASFAQVNAAEVLESLVNRYRIGDRQEPARVVTVDVDSAIEGRWDRNAVTIILERILDNAVQHTEPPHEIELSACTTGNGSVKFSVSDAGHGIPADILDKAMLPFFPQHSGRPGLGLAIADKFARFLGGRLEIDSREGEGTEVRCFLPTEPETVLGD
jgi:signal transduction histidine kinase